MFVGSDEPRQGIKDRPPSGDVRCQVGLVDVRQGPELLAHPFLVDLGGCGVRFGEDRMPLLDDIRL